MGLKKDYPHLFEAMKREIVEGCPQFNHKSPLVDIELSNTHNLYLHSGKDWVVIWEYQDGEDEHTPWNELDGWWFDCGEVLRLNRLAEIERVLSKLNQ